MPAIVDDDDLDGAASPSGTISRFRQSAQSSLNVGMMIEISTIETRRRGADRASAPCECRPGMPSDDSGVNRTGALQPEGEMPEPLILPEIVAEVSRIAGGDKELQRAIDAMIGDDGRARRPQVDVVLPGSKEQRVERDSTLDSGQRWSAAVRC